MSHKQQILEFLYRWTNEKKIPHLKPGMVEEMDAFLASILSNEETKRAVANMSARKAIELDKDLKVKVEEEEQNSEKEG